MSRPRCSISRRTAANTGRAADTAGKSGQGWSMSTPSGLGRHRRGPRERRRQLEIFVDPSTFILLHKYHTQRQFRHQRFFGLDQAMVQLSSVMRVSRGLSHVFQVVRRVRPWPSSRPRFSHGLWEHKRNSSEERPENTCRTYDRCDACSLRPVPDDEQQEYIISKRPAEFGPIPANISPIEFEPTDIGRIDPERRRAPDGGPEASRLQPACRPEKPYPIRQARSRFTASGELLWS